MTSATGHYDQALLASAPEVTGSQRQGGYTTDILTANHGKATPPLTAQSDLESGLVTKEYDHQPATRALPFWRTRKGMIIIFVAGIVILAAVIGGAVGGTAGKKSSKGAPDTSAPGVGGGSGDSGAPGKGGATTSADPAPSPPGPTATAPGAPVGSDTGAGVGGAKPTTTGPPATLPTLSTTTNSQDTGGGGGDEQTGGMLLSGAVMGAQVAGIAKEHA